MQQELTRWNLASATALDSAERDGVLLASDSGTHVRVPARTHQFLVAIQTHADANAIALTMGAGISAEIIADQARQLIGSLRRVRETPRRDRFFLFRLRLLRRERIVAIVRHLVWAFRPSVALLSMPLAIGLVLAFAPAYADVSFTGNDAVPAYLLLLVSTFVHELGHATASVRTGAPPREIGFTTYVIYPAFYSDVTEAWRLSRWQRVLVDIGGVYFQLWTVGVFAALYAATGWRPLGTAVWFTAGSIGFQLNPLFKFDGYWIVADSLGITNLYEQPRRLVRHVWARLRGVTAPSWPWPRVITAVLIPYSIATFAFLTVYFVLLGPTVADVLVAYPGLLRRLGLGLLGTGPGLELRLFIELLSSSFLLCVAGMLAWRALLSIAAMFGVGRDERVVTP
jgi:putative peptide zinc metalloprotease protein